MDSQFLPPKTHAAFWPKPLSIPVIIAAALFALAASIMISISGAAGNASFSVSPNTGSYDKNSSFSVNVYVNSGSETINAVDARLSYEAAKLQFVSVSNTGSPYTLCYPPLSGGGGDVTISCAKPGGTTTGQQLVAKVTFKVLAGSGSSVVSFKSGSAIVKSPENTDIWNGSTTGGTYNFKTPASAGSSSNPVAPNNSSSTNTSSNSDSGASSQPSGGSTSQPNLNPSSSAQPSAPSTDDTATTTGAETAAYNPVINGSGEKSTEKKSPSSIVPIIAIGSLIGILLAIAGYFGRSYLMRLLKRDTHNLQAFSDLSTQQAGIGVLASKKIVNANNPHPLEERLSKIRAPQIPSPGSKISPNSK